MTSEQVREDVDNKRYRVPIGFLGLFALLCVAVELVEPLSFAINEGAASVSLRFWVMVTTPPAGWGGLVYVCWIRSGRITDAALNSVLALGVFGMAISLLALNAQHSIPSKEIPMAIVFLTGIWIMNGLGIVWIVQKVGRIRAASNTDAADEA